MVRTEARRQYKVSLWSSPSVMTLAGHSMRLLPHLSGMLCFSLQVLGKPLPIPRTCIVISG